MRLGPSDMLCGHPPSPSPLGRAISPGHLFTRGPAEDGKLSSLTPEVLWVRQELAGLTRCNQSVVA